MRGWLAFVAVVLISLAMMSCGSSTASPAQATAEASRCADAITQVQAYKAPGSRLTLVESLAVQLTAERQRRPVQTGRWDIVKTGGPECLVAYRLTLGNEAQSLYWVYDPKTHA